MPFLKKIWGFDEGEHHCYLTTWKNFLFPISRGGLGMRDMELVNIAMLLKLVWRFITDPQVLKVRVLSSIYLRYDYFWSVNAKNSNSNLWKSLLSIRHIMYQYSCWSIGWGDKINIWRDVWIPNFNFLITPIRFYNPMPNVVSDLIFPSTKSWNLTLIKKFFDPVIVNLISNIHLSQDPNQEDKLM